jgi:23S rRNA pseudouridine2604 synthase
VPHSFIDQNNGQLINFFLHHTPMTSPPVFKRAPRPEGKGETAVPSGTSRLNKRMAELRMCSRREADAWIEQGWVKVNGQVASMGQQVTLSDRITVDRAAEQQQERQVTILLHKPMGYVSGQAEDGHEPAITLINPRSHWMGDPTKMRFTPPHLRGLAPAGRLDIDSTGLLVLTQDGRVARQLIGEDSEMEKEYLVRVAYTGHENTAAASAASATYGGKANQLSTIGDNDRVTNNVQAVFPLAQLERLRHGLSLDGKPLKPAKVEWQNPEQLRFVLTEGKKRQIRRMCEQVGLKVVGLKRIRMGRVQLGQMPAGTWRYLGPNESF